MEFMKEPTSIFNKIRNTICVLCGFKFDILFIKIRKIRVKKDELIL